MRRRSPVLIVALVVVATLASVATGFSVTPGTWLAPETVTKIAREWLLEQLGGDVDPAALETSGTPREITLPPGDVSMHVALQSGSVAAGAMTVLVEAVVAEGAGRRTARSATVGFRVNTLQNVVVAIRELPRRAIVREGDVRVERRAASRAVAGAVHESRDVVGREVTRPLAPGEVVTSGSLTVPMVIRRGQAVSLVVEGAGFRILARGVAAEDGARGQSIRVVNQTSRKEVVGRVEDERTVRIAY